MTNVLFQSTRLSRASTASHFHTSTECVISIHKALASLDDLGLIDGLSAANFNPQGSREPRLNCLTDVAIPALFQSTRLSRASTSQPFCIIQARNISIHKALASLDIVPYICQHLIAYFNPQGSREPRLIASNPIVTATNFNPQGSREPRQWSGPGQRAMRYFNPQGSREPRRKREGEKQNRNQFQSTRLSRASTPCTPVSP